MLSAIKSVKFCAGHRLMNHEGDSRALHGHNWVVDVDVHQIDREVDFVGHVVDPIALEYIVKNWINEHWEYAVILEACDTAAIEAVKSVRPSKVFAMPYSPTPENMARFLGSEVLPGLLAPLGLRCCMVIIHESSDSCAVWRDQ